MNQILLGSPGVVRIISQQPSAGTVSKMDMGGGCKISMLWNWNTIDACFISSSWRITSRGMFAASCIGVILLVVSLEFFRRLSKEYDRYILQRFKQSIVTLGQNPTPQKSDSILATATATTAATTTLPDTSYTSNTDSCLADPTTALPSTFHFRPTLLQQSIRALLHMVTFAIAYFVMLLAMYYNGYFIICIFIGAYLGAFVFTWERIGVSIEASTTGTAAMEDVTVCCG